jgi:predicted acetyltransferase
VGHFSGAASARTPRGQKTQGYLAAHPENGRAEGYVYLYEKESADHPYVLSVTDLTALTPAAGNTLLRFLSEHRSINDEIVMYGRADDPLFTLLPERNYSVRLLDHWMVRIVDVGAALMARGYGPALTCELHLDVHDDVLLANNGRFVLELHNGVPTVSTGGQGTMQIDIRALASLYTGFNSPAELLGTGRLQVASRSASASDPLAAAQAVFAGPAPWMTEMF